MKHVFPVPRRTTMLAAGERIRVLVVDDSVVIRRLVAHAIEEDADFEVAGVAANGAIALAKIPQLNPHAITLDIEMPEMDGLEALRRIRVEYPQLRVIMFSTLTERGAAKTMEALSLGADDYVTKASNAGSLDRSMASLRTELLPKIKQFFRTAIPQACSTTIAQTLDVMKPPVAAPIAASRAGVEPRVVGIGVSTGGPGALGVLLPSLPAEFPLPIVVVQHMPPLFTALLAERLQTVSKLRVKEAAEGDRVEPGRVLIAPGDFHMRVRNRHGRTEIELDQAPPENSCRPSVDVLFRSLADTYGGAVTSVVLTGMGHDGLRGAAALRARGAVVIAQDEATSVVWGMPGSVVTAGLADAVVPLPSIAAALVERASPGVAAR